jgi:phenylalanyl-tRNA synthetase beta chain
MKIPYSWLKEIVDISVTPEQLSTDLASIGIETASINKIRIPEGVIAAKILSVEKHPNADRLSVCKVDTGSGRPEQIVCGAPNVRPGMLSALALPGSVLGPDMIVKKTKIRGVESGGMLCSERELTLSDDHSGIMDLPQDMTPGKKLTSCFSDDAVLEIEITPNRGDCLSILGVAREVSAKYGLPLKNPAMSPIEGSPETLCGITVEIENTSACPRYLGRMVKGITVAESPDWLKRKLISSGLRPINNIVDITNYIMLLFGQPMHAFDCSKIAGNKIVVKNAADGQQFVTLDNTERKLRKDDLLICDAEKPVALAGIMGGANSQIFPETKDVFFECAYFEPVGIRKTSRRLDLSSDSSYRFERGVDWADGLKDALETAAELARRLGNGVVAHGLIDANPATVALRRIKIRPDRAARILGVDIGAERITSMLESLGIKQAGGQNGTLEFIAPAWRHDLGIEADLIEEAGRMYGYDAIPASQTAFVDMTRSVNPARSIIDTLRKSLAFSGFNEAITNSMTSAKLAALLKPQAAQVLLKNPLNPDMAVMRTSLTPGLLGAIAHNLNRKNRNNRFFEIGKIFIASGTDTLPEEKDCIGIVMEGSAEPAFWAQKEKPADFYILKSVVETCVAQSGARNPVWTAVDSAADMLTEESGQVVFDNGITGVAGRIKPEICSSFDIDSQVFYAELDFSSLLSTQIKTPRYSVLPRHPAVERDLCFVMAESIPSGAPASLMRSISNMVECAEPFDVYRGDKLGAGIKSIAYAIRLRAPDRTLTDTESDAVCGQIISAMKDNFKATLRS